MRVRLEGHKKPIMNTHYKYVLGGSDVYSTSTNAYSLPLMHICNGLVCIHNGFFYDPQPDSQY